MDGTALRRARVASQWLDRRRRREVVDVVGHLVGVQAQVLPSAGLAVRARSAGVTEGGVGRARTDDRSVVLCWAMRGTLHLVSAEDHGRLVPLMNEPHVSRSLRRLRQEGVDADAAWKGVRLIHRTLEREGPLVRSEVAARLRRRGIRTEGQAIAHLVWLAASDGTVCFGPDRGAERALVLARDWLGAGQGQPGREEVLADLAVRYLRSHGPADEADLAAWSGLRASDARRAFGAIAGRLRRAGRLWTVGPAATRRGAAPTRLLPAFDEYLLGWKDRSFAVRPSHAGRVNAGGGWVHPTVLRDGLVAGRWRLDRGRTRATVSVEPFGEASIPGLATEVGDLARYLGGPVEGPPR